MVEAMARWAGLGQWLDGPGWRQWLDGRGSRTFLAVFILQIVHHQVKGVADPGFWKGEGSSV